MCSHVQSPHSSDMTASENEAQRKYICNGIRLKSRMIQHKVFSRASREIDTLDKRANVFWSVSSTPNSDKTYIALV